MSGWCIPSGEGPAHCWKVVGENSRPLGSRFSAQGHDWVARPTEIDPEKR